MRQPRQYRRPHPCPSGLRKAPRNPKTLEERQERLEQEIAEQVNDYHFEERDPLEGMR